MIFSKKTHDGELMVDHRASPGLSAELAEKMGYHPGHVRGGALATYATLGCPHCASCVVVKHDRTRDRAWCSTCDRYICDGCDYLRKQPGYVHTTAAEIIEKVRSGKYTLSGTFAQPTLTKTGE
jgi:hypothetical protein